MKNASNQIIEIINDDNFKESLKRINSNYPNIKQENLLRNVILELYNEKFSDELNRAFAEHPRIEKKSTDDSKRKSSGRVDLSIMNLNVLDDKGKPKPYKIEFKHHFSSHRNDFSDYKDSIENEFKGRESDMFILVVSEWEKKIEFDEKWDISTKLTRYLSKDKEKQWKNNLLKCFSCFPNTNLYTTEIFIDVPYPTTYYFYVLTN